MIGLIIVNLTLPVDLFLFSLLFVFWLNETLKYLAKPLLYVLVDILSTTLWWWWSGFHSNNDNVELCALYEKQSFGVYK